MGDASTPLTLNEVRHLLRRTGFGGGKQRDIDKLVGRARGDVVADLVEFKASRFAPKSGDSLELQDKWIKYILKARQPLQEKLVVFWHDHFASSNVTVDNIRMVQQNKTLRKHCTGINRSRFEQSNVPVGDPPLPPRGNFKDFVKAINKDPAMMQFLNTEDNLKGNPNENYARELQELFCLGVLDSAGQPNYTQEDVFQIARAFTGWHTHVVSEDIVKDLGLPVPPGLPRDWRIHHMASDRHDFMANYPARGPKVIFKSTGGFGAAGKSFTVNGEGEAEIDTVIDIIFQHTDSQGKNTVARYITRRMISYLAHPNPDQGFVDDVVTNSQFDTLFDVREMVRSILLDDRFYESMAPAGPGVRKSVKLPTDFVLGTLKLLGIRPKRSDLRVNDSGSNIVREYLTDMGMTLNEPPSVFGWPWEEAWLGSTRLKERYQFSVDVTRAAGAGTASVRFERLIDLGEQDPSNIVDAALAALQVDDQFSTNDRLILIDYLGPGPIDFVENEAAFNEKLRGLFALIIQSPAYQLY